jgi:Putative antitoxin of bacterial toxin-antitoxin system, YdaS/YdaT
MLENAQEILTLHKVKRIDLAAHLGVTPGAISGWGRFPAERVPLIEEFTGIPRHELRPDLWDAPFVTDDGIKIDRSTGKSLLQGRVL